ncbi:hypothetical protein ACTQ49_12785 [Luteococcus sp. Sow4_B9]|uniref:hypothetical protein n=1 Tax=Luteococcus sp. Sow4_B9 TaxID=3438792 RepID=UPI003F950B00
MVWLLLWTGIAALWLIVLAICGWRLWTSGRALLRELEGQGRQLGDLLDVLGELQLPASGPSGQPMKPRADRRH